VVKPRGRTMTCQHCMFVGHRDVAAAFTIASRTPGGACITPPTMGGVLTHRRAGRHLPGAGLSRRDPRRRPPRAAVPGSVGRLRPAPPLLGSRSPCTTMGEEPQHHRQPGER
jgi:putative transposase